ncbi:MAG: RDD family protein, partial [Moraxellaceae bacterium]
MAKKKRPPAKAAPTPEPVSNDAPAALPPTPAGLRVRLACIVYDGLLLIALWMIVTAILVPLGTPDAAADSKELAVVPDWYRQLVLFPALVLVTWLFYGYFWTRIGQTLGMQTWRLKVVRTNGSLPRWRDAFARCASACLFPLACALIAQVTYGSSKAVLLSLCMGFLLNYLWMLWSRAGISWHDQLSGTRVLRLPPEPKKR